MLTPDEVQPNMPVVYRPRDGGKPEDGVVVRLSENPDLAFVRYASGGTPKATYLRDLEAVGW